MNLTDSEALEYATIENVMRQDIHELHEAEGYARILAANPSYTPAILAERVENPSVTFSAVCSFSSLTPS